MFQAIIHDLGNNKYKIEGFLNGKKVGEHEVIFREYHPLNNFTILTPFRREFGVSLEDIRNAEIVYADGKPFQPKSWCYGLNDEQKEFVRKVVLVGLKSIISSADAYRILADMYSEQGEQFQDLANRFETITNEASERYNYILQRDFYPIDLSHVLEYAEEFEATKEELVASINEFVFKEEIIKYVDFN